MRYFVSRSLLYCCDHFQWSWRAVGSTTWLQVCVMKWVQICVAFWTCLADGESVWQLGCMSGSGWRTLKRLYLAIISWASVSVICIEVWLLVEGCVCSFACMSVWLWYSIQMECNFWHICLSQMFVWFMFHAQLSNAVICSQSKGAILPPPLPLSCLFCLKLQHVNTHSLNLQHVNTQT